MTARHEWTAYYDEFKPHFSANKVRKDNHPRIRLRPGARGSIVLVHGLSDSPYYMAAIADYFHDELGYNVFLPLLHCHGLKKPKGMEEVELTEWKRNVAFAVNAAAKRTPDRVSIGGLSTGGALSYYFASMSPKITADLYLFSAALDLNMGPIGLVGDLAERLLRNKRLVDFLDKRDSEKPLIGDNPVKYDYIDKDGARELARLIKELDTLTGGYSKKQPFNRRVFAAHSHADKTANIAGIKNLQKRTATGKFTSYYIPKDKGVTHGGLVLKDDVVGASGNVCTPKNNQFDSMMRALAKFEGVAQRVPAIGSLS